MRVKTIRLAIIVFFVLILAALIYMQIIRGDMYYGQSATNRIRVIPIDAKRGEIMDRQGEILAYNREAFHVAVIDQETYDRTALFKFLAKVLNKEPDSIEHLYSRRRTNPFAPVVVAEDISMEQVFKIEENKFLYPGLIILNGYQRVYPFGASVGHAVGYIGKITEEEIYADTYGYTPLSYIGKNGIEKSYDDILRGSSGGNQVEVNARGQQVRILSIKQPESGQDILLSIDAKLSKQVVDLLGDRRGAVVVMDVSDGSIPILVSSPSINPNAFVDKKINDQVTQYFTDPNAPFLNRAVTGKFVPGSVFKIPVALAALQDHKVIPSTTYNCPGFMMLGNRRFGCAHVHHDEDFLGAIAESCNVYFFHLGQMLGVKTINAYAKAFGLGRDTGIDLPFESSGYLRSESKKKKWFGGDILNLSIGQGETLTTPLQVAVMMGAVATDGYIIKPRLVTAIDGHDLPEVDITKNARVKLRDEVWDIVKTGMRQTITSSTGTAHQLSDLTGMTIWGKTGTAQTSKGKENHAWFAGFVKGQSRTYAFCIFLEHGGSSARAVELTKDVLTLMKNDNWFN